MTAQEDINQESEVINKDISLGSMFGSISREDIETLKGDANSLSFSSSPKHSYVESQQVEEPIDVNINKKGTGKKKRLSKSINAEATIINTIPSDSEIRNLVAKAGYDAAQYAIKEYQRGLTKLDSKETIPSEIPVTFEVQGIITFEFSYMIKQEFDDFIILVLKPNQFTINVSPQQESPTFLHFNDKLVAGYLLGKPFKLNLPGTENVEILIFLKDSETE